MNWKAGTIANFLYNELPYNIKLIFFNTHTALIQLSFYELMIKYMQGCYTSSKSMNTWPFLASNLTSVIAKQETSTLFKLLMNTHQAISTTASHSLKRELIFNRDSQKRVIAVNLWRRIELKKKFFGGRIRRRRSRGPATPPHLDW